MTSTLASMPSTPPASARAQQERDQRAEGELESRLPFSPADRSPRDIADLRDDIRTLAVRQARLEKVVASPGGAQPGAAGDQAFNDEKVASLETFVGDLMAKQGQLSTEVDALRDLPASCALLRKQFESLAPLLGEAAGARAADSKSIHTAMNRQSGDLQAARDQISSMEARMAAMERKLGSMASSFGPGAKSPRPSVPDGRMAAMEDRLSEMSREVSLLKASRGQAGAISERVSMWEQDLADHSARHSAELEALRALVAGQEQEIRRATEECSAASAQLDERCRVLRDDCEAIAHTVQALRESQEHTTRSLTERVTALDKAAAAQTGELDALRRAAAAGTEERSRDVVAVKDAIAKLAVAPGTYDKDFVEYRGLFCTQAQHASRLSQVEQAVRDTDFFQLLPDRLKLLEKRVTELSQRPVLREVLLPALPSQPTPAVLPSSPRKASSGAQVLEALHSMVAQHITVVNDRRHVLYEQKAHRALLLVEITMKRRHYGSDHIDEPTAEWESEAAVQPMLQDVAFLFRIFSTAAADLHRDNAVTATVVSTRNRYAKFSAWSRPGMSSRASLPSRTDRVQQWETQLAQNRAHLVADSLAGHGIPRTSIGARVEHGPQAAYAVEFHFNLRGSLGIPDSTFGSR
mmetsp:Transcript_75901/g.220398  ORF Transcript_75901/g.220398 Transcript_75901/m.220398 type:complete len:638 (+) Transcript_75901:64-1977(+)